MILAHLHDERTSRTVYGTSRRSILPALGIAVFVCLRALALPDYSNGILDPDTVRREAQSVTSERYPNADDVLVDDYIVVQYEADGRSVEWDDTFVKVLTEKGKRENTTLTRHFTLPYSRASYTLVQIIKADGTLAAVDVEKQSRVMTDRSQMGANIYNPNQKVLTVGVPGLEIGDIVRYVAFREVVKPRVPDTWSDYQVFEYTSPVKHYVYEVLAPTELPLRRIVLKGEVAGTVTHTKGEKEGRLLYRWEVKDVPRMYEEPNMPPLHTVVQRLLVSTIPDWRDISRWYWALSEPHLATTQEMRDKVSELVGAQSAREAKLRALFRFVSQDIRYMGITVEKEAPGYEPHDVRLTFENRHGVCRDKAALLVAMLREAGFNAFPVLIHNGPKKDEEVPQPFFNHAISAVENDDGSYLLMDSTDENTKEMFPAYLCNQSYLVAKPDGETLLTSPIVPATENMMRIRTQASLDADGNLTAASVLKFEGINDNAYRGHFSRLKQEDRRRFFEGALKRFAAGARLTGLEIEPKEMLDTDTPLEIRIEFEADSILVSNDALAMLPVPRLGTRIGIVNFILGKTGLEKRKYPLVTDIACGVHETLQLKLDPAIGMVESLPEFPEIRRDTMSWTRALRVDDGVLNGESEFLLTAVELDPQQYLQLKDDLKTIEVNARKKPIFKRVAEPEPTSADIAVIDDVWDYDVTDAHTWTETHEAKWRILTYKGKKDHSELKWDYNPVWEDVELIHARVTTGEVTKSISAAEVNLMDAGWVAGAPRYPAGKTLVASLPGVEVGSVIEFKAVRRFRDRPFFALRHSFRGHDPIERKTVRLAVPPSLHLQTGKYDSGFGLEAGAGADAGVIHETVSARGGKLVFEWSVEGQPAVEREDALPPWWSFNPTVLVSSGDWKEYARIVRNVLLQAARGQDACGALAREVIRDAATAEERLCAIRDCVAKRIRAAGPGIDALPLPDVTAAGTTLSDGYGNSADQAVLLWSMLHAAGFAPEFVLASWAPREQRLRRIVPEYPASSWFPVVLVRVRTPVGYVYLNDTDQYAELGATSHDGHPGLVLRKGRVESIEALPGAEDRSEAQFDIVLRDDGDAVITKTVRYYGTAFGGRNRTFAEMPPEKRRRYHQEALAQLSQSAAADGELRTDFSSYPGVEAFTASVADFAVRDDRYLYLNLPGGLRNLLGLRADERTNSLYWSGPRRSHVVTSVTLPEAFPQVILVPGTVDWTAPCQAGSVRVQYDSPTAVADAATSQKQLRLVHDVDLMPAVLAARDYSRLLELNQALSHARAWTLMLGSGVQPVD